MKYITHEITIDGKWTEIFESKYGFKLENGFWYRAPKTIAEGGFCVIPVNDFFSVMVADFERVNEEVTFCRNASENNNFWGFFYDLSYKTNIHIVNGEEYKVGGDTDLNFGILDGNLSSFFCPAVGDRVFSFRMFVDKKYTSSILKGAAHSEFFDVIINEITEQNYFYGYANSKAIIQVKKVMDVDINSGGYEIFLKSMAYKVFGYFIKCLTEYSDLRRVYVAEDISSLLESKNYLEMNLKESFPGIDFLADNAGMSKSKYKKMFSDIYGVSPAIYHKKQKLAHAREIILSGDFDSIRDLADEMEYYKTSYFNTIFKEEFGVSPQELLQTKKQ